MANVMRTWSALLTDLGEAGYRLREALPVVLREDDAGWVTARVLDFGVVGEGVTVDAALAQLRQAILDLYDELAGCDPAMLGDLPREWWRELERLIERIL
jgi:hypothetical protein